MKLEIKKDKREGIKLRFWHNDSQGTSVHVPTLAELNKINIEIDNFISNYNPECQAFDSFFDEFSFGKYKGMILNDVVEQNSQYIDWCLDNEVISINPKILTRFLRKMEQNK